MQGKQFGGFKKTATPLFLPKVAACCRKPKIHRDSPLARAVWSVGTTLYFCMASVPARFLSTPHPQQSVRNLLPYTSLFCVGYSQQGRCSKDLPLSMKGTPRGWCCSASTSTCREVCIPDSWRVRQAEEWKSSHRVSMLSLQMLSCYQLFKSFWAVGNLPPVNVSNSRKFSNSWEEGCQHCACFTATILKTCSFLLKQNKTKTHKNQTCNHTLVCPANSDFVVSFPCPATHSSSHKIAKGLRRCCFAILTFLTYAHMPSVMLCVHCPFNHTSEANSLLAVPSFRSWMIILISRYRASQEQWQGLSASVQLSEVQSTALVVKHNKNNTGSVSRAVSNWGAARALKNWTLREAAHGMASIEHLSMSAWGRVSGGGNCTMRDRISL